MRFREEDSNPFCQLGSGIVKRSVLGRDLEVIDPVHEGPEAAAALALQPTFMGHDLGGEAYRAAPEGSLRSSRFIPNGFCSHEDARAVLPPVSGPLNE
jgi:hypothetical protein